MKNFVGFYNTKLCSFLTGYPQQVLKVARQKGIATFNKTRYASHRRFLSLCLQRKCIPNGFRLQFNAQGQQNGILQKCSYNLMRTSLKNYVQKMEECSKLIVDSTKVLEDLCSEDVLKTACRKIHGLN